MVSPFFECLGGKVGRHFEYFLKVSRIEEKKKVTTRARSDEEFEVLFCLRGTRVTHDTSGWRLRFHATTL